MQTIHVCNHTTPEAIYPFDARGIAKRFRHAAIFGALDALMPGETMRFCNDHDPLPLLGQLQQRYGEKVTITYQQREPGAIVIEATGIRDVPSGPLLRIGRSNFCPSASSTCGGAQAPHSPPRLATSFKMVALRYA